MTPSEHRVNDRTTYYTMKTPPGLVPAAGAQGLGRARSNSQSYVSCKPTTSPMPSPRVPRPSKLSPGGVRPGGPDPRATSPNYFGLAVDPIADPRDSAKLPLENWSSPSSSVKSFAAALPKQMPLDANPDFEAFRRQIDANRARAAFSLSASHFTIQAGGPLTPPAPTPSTLHRPRPPRWHTQGHDGSDFPWPRPQRLGAASSGVVDVPAGKADRDVDSLQEDSAYVSGDSKRSSAVSLNPRFFANIGTMGKHETAPSSIQSPFPGLGQGGFNLAMPKINTRPSPQPPARGKADSPLTNPRQQPVAPEMPGAGGPTMMSPAELKDLLENDQGATVLLLDLRVSPQFAQSRVKGAMNLCIPTTLLKRATFNLQKLQQTFQADGDQDKFANWRDASHLVVYDASSLDTRDAVSALNMIKKFTNEGYSGPTSILRGGFNAVSAAYPDLIDRSSGWPSSDPSLGTSSVSGGKRTNLPAVIGGVLLPNASNIANPFFNNIRQNQDLVDGVGQMEIGMPSGLAQDSLPCWLRDATGAGDHGKRVSDKFLRIELLEQARMRDAYSSFKSATTVQEEAARVQLSGIEKGGKNRYKDILPFEHARVRLQGRPEGGCDYVNASHIQAKRSYKRYIASQGPLPATFEDFWSVVWDQDVRVIVMLTAESEGGQLKCHPYWKGNDFGPIKLRVLSEKKISLDIDGRRPPSGAAAGTTTSTAANDDCSASDACPTEGARRRANTATTAVDPVAQTSNPFNFNPQPSGAAETPHVVIRKFALSHAAHPFLPIREITQLHYPSWPDFGAPAQPSHLLALVELANVMQRATAPAGGPRTVDDRPESNEHARPMLVHCSAGCGRTGAFCTVDSVIDMLKRQRLHTMAQATRRQGDGSNGAQGPALRRDSEGDVEMDGCKAEHSHSANSSGNNSGIDTSWLADDSIDLISQTVEDFRGQRLSMVQSLRQFVLCYETILEWILRVQQHDSGAPGTRGRGRSGSLTF